jgi:PadR family transcriptional regulator
LINPWTLGQQQKAILVVLNSSKAQLTTREVCSAVCAKFPEASRKKHPQASIFIALDRLSQRNLVERWKGKPSPVRGGKARIYYRIAEAGRLAVAAP